VSGRVLLALPVALVGLILAIGQLMEGDQWEVQELDNGCLTVTREHVPALPGPNEHLSTGVYCPTEVTP